jgi:hypothetical protein
MAPGETLARDSFEHDRVELVDLTDHLGKAGRGPMLAEWRVPEPLPCPDAALPPLCRHAFDHDRAAIGDRTHHEPLSAFSGEELELGHPASADG